MNSEPKRLIEMEEDEDYSVIESGRFKIIKQKLESKTEYQIIMDNVDALTDLSGLKEKEIINLYDVLEIAVKTWIMKNKQ